MAAGQLHAFIRHLRSVMHAEGSAGLTDAELLERFVTLHDQAGFEVLLWRHGPMVLSVCRRLLRNEEDVEDAFQATFLALARKAGSIAKRDAVGSWLYKVAYRIALDARRLSAHRVAHERAAAMVPAVKTEQDIPREIARRELHSLVDAEIQRLPRKYRDPVVLCHLEGKTQDEAARELGWAKGTVSTRLIHARELLRRRLHRHGDAFPATALLPALVTRLPSNLAKITLRAVLSVQTPTATGGLISARALTLAEGVLKAMAMSQWKTTAALLLILASLGTGAGWLAYQGTQASPGSGDSGQVSPQNHAVGKSADHEFSSALGKLDPNRIPPEDRFAWQPPELVSVLGEHRGRSWAGVHCVAFSPDGKRIASCGGDPFVRLWDAVTLRECAALEHPSQSVRCLAFSPDGKILAAGGTYRSGDPDRTLILWELRVTPPRARAVLKLSESLLALAFSPDGSTLACGEREGVRLWKVAGDREPEQLSLLPQDRASSLAFSGDGKTLAAGGFDDSITVWNLSAGTHRTLPKANFPFGLHSIALSPDGKVLARTGDAVRPSPPGNRSNRSDEDLEPRRYAVILWDLTDPDHPRERPILSKPTWQVFAAKFSPDGKSLATGNHDGTLRLWSVAGATPTERAIVQSSSWIYSLDFSRDGKNLVVGHGSGMVTLWDSTALVPTERFTHQGHMAAVDWIALARKGTLASGSYDGTTRVWDLSGAQGKERFLFTGHSSMGGLALARDGTTLAFDNGEGALEVWDIGKEKPRKRLQWSARMKENNMGIYGLEMSPDGKVLVTNGFDNVVRFWDLTTEPPRERNHFAGHGHVRRVYIHSDGRSATLPIYDSNPDGADLALWKSGPIVRIWDVTARAPGQRQVPLENRDHVYELTFVPDGSEMAARAEKLDVLSDPLRLKRSDGPRSWSVRLEGSDSAMRGERESMRRGWHQQSPSAILWGAVSPDGQTLASAARDGKVILWEAATGGKYREWQLPGTVRRVEFAEDGRHLITANGNGTLYVLRLGQGVTALNDLAKLWETLASLHAGKAYPAIWSLIATPQRTVPFIKERLHPVEAPTTAEIQQLVDRLDDAQFKEREKATAALEELRQQAEPALRRKLAEQSSSPELRRRIEALLEKSKLISPSQLRMLRVIQILEQIGNADAQQLLKRLAQGAPQARETPQAQAALKRLAKRSDILR